MQAELLFDSKAYLEDAALNQHPLSGEAFRLETDVEGMPAFEFAG